MVKTWILLHFNNFYCSQIRKKNNYIQLYLKGNKRIFFYLNRICDFLAMHVIPYIYSLLRLHFSKILGF